MTTKPKAKPIAGEVVETFPEVEQRTEEWAALRRGCMTSSNFKKIMASGKDGDASKTRALLMRQLAGEILTGETAETFRNEAMQRGNDMEDEAADHYAKTSFASLSKVGFVRRTITCPLGSSFVVGASPDRFIDEEGVLEIKTARPDIIIEVLERGASGFPPEHKQQCQGTLWVTGRSWCELMIFYRGMPAAPKFRVYRDEGYISEIARACEVFDYELHQLVKKIRSYAR